jgi:NTP pyrophosphatase (non-canonical NTP hydrolase)
MKLDQYLVETVVTESPTKPILDRITSPEGMKEFASFLVDLDTTIKTLQKLDQWKKRIFYNKPLDIDMRVPKLIEHPEVINSEFVRLLHSSMGIATEACELLEALVKVLEGKELDKVNLAEELGDVMWYIGLMVDTTKSDFEKIMGNNNTKLKLRFPNKFEEFYALNRNLEAERKVLEQ